MRVADATSEVPRRRMAVVRAWLEATQLRDGDAAVAQAAALATSKRASELIATMLPFQLTHAECDVATEGRDVVLTVTLQAFARAPLAPAAHLAAGAALAAMVERHGSPGSIRSRIETVQDVVD